MCILNIIYYVYIIHICTLIFEIWNRLYWLLLIFYEFRYKYKVTYFIDKQTKLRSFIFRIL